LPAPEVATASWRDYGEVVLCPDRQTMVAVSDKFAPEHLELAISDARAFSASYRHAGALFLGGQSAEAFGDYGAGPNHTLPTSGRARSSGGLSVFDFLRIRTWLRMDGPDEGLVGDTALLARAEGLYAHARSADRRSASS